MEGLTEDVYRAEKLTLAKAIVSRVVELLDLAIVVVKREVGAAVEGAKADQRR